jgi:hypothetical protein
LNPDKFGQGADELRSSIHAELDCLLVHDLSDG